MPDCNAISCVTTNGLFSVVPYRMDTLGATYIFRVTTSTKERGHHTDIWVSIEELNRVCHMLNVFIKSTEPV